MNYRHAYHAGSFADAFKHITLIALIKAFLRKESPFCYLETQAGTGSYDLTSKAALATKEFKTGVAKIRARSNPPELVQNYLQIIEKMNHGSDLKIYPGSPYFVKQLLRPQDRMILSELHPDECQVLKRFFPHDKQVAIHCQDGYLSLKAFLPPKEKRGLVLIDPAYEKADEFEQLTKILPEAVKRWETGTFALWYPIKSRTATDRFLKTITEKISRPTLITELSVYPEDNAQQLNGSGMLIVNPPWQLDEELKNVLPWVWEALSVNKQGQYSIKI